MPAKIVLIPPPFRINYLTERFGGQFASDTNYTPIQFSSSGSSMQGTIQTQNPLPSDELYDPMMTMGDLFHFPTAKIGHRVEKEASRMIYAMTREHISRAFWGRKHLEEIVAQTFTHDLLVQIDNGLIRHSDEFSTTPRWNFSPTSPDDQEALSFLINIKEKEHRFQNHYLLRDEIIAWVRENCRKDWDYDPKGGSFIGNGNLDEIFIRDDVEAIHYKMRWYGAEPPEVEDVQF
jgi:hypothetical protein